MVAGARDPGEQLGQVVGVEPGGVWAREQAGAAGVRVGGLALQRGEEGGDEGLFAGQVRDVEGAVQLGEGLVEIPGELAVAIFGVGIGGAGELVQAGDGVAGLSIERTKVLGLAAGSAAVSWLAWR